MSSRRYGIEILAAKLGTINRQVMATQAGPEAIEQFLNIALNLGVSFDHKTGEVTIDQGEAEKPYSKYVIEAIGDLVASINAVVEELDEDSDQPLENMET